MHEILTQYRSWAKYFFFFGGGGGATWPSETYVGPGEKKTLKIFEIFIPEIAANASNFKT